jgi:uncharacterized protein related to proFAR isomerase
MAITKESSNIEITISGPYKILNVKEETLIKENNIEISKSNNRSSYDPLSDTSALPSDVAEIANVVWTQAIKDSYQAYLDSL